MLDLAYRRLTQGPAAKPVRPSRNPAPRILTLGGDHLTTLFALRRVRAIWGKVNVLHFGGHYGRLPRGMAGEVQAVDIAWLTHAHSSNGARYNLHQQSGAGLFVRRCASLGR